MDNKYTYTIRGKCLFCKCPNTMVNIDGYCETCQKEIDEKMSNGGLDFKVTVPGSILKVHANSRKEAIDMAIKIWEEEIKKAQEDKTIYAIKDLVKILK